MSCVSAEQSRRCARQMHSFGGAGGLVSFWAGTATPSGELPYPVPGPKEIGFLKCLEFRLAFVRQQS